MTDSSKRWLYALWLIFILSFALLHALHLRADFPNHSPWMHDAAKYTDEGWWGNGAVRAHLSGNWYLAGDFNPAPAAPVWPFLEWLLFFITGVTLQAVRGLAVGIFFANLLLSYLLLRSRGPRWMALLALTLMVTSPFLYCFSRLAILEPLLTALTLAALNLAVRLPRMRRPIRAALGIGLLFTLMLLTKTTAVFLLPALGWALVLPLWRSRASGDPGKRSLRVGWKLAMRCALAAAGGFALSFSLWMALVARLGLLPDFKYLFFINNYGRPPGFSWLLVSFWWAFHGSLWVDHMLIPLAGVLVASAALGWRSEWGRKLLLDPVFGASILAAAGYFLFMTYQHHTEPRYFAVVAYFSFFVVALAAEALLGEAGPLRWPAAQICCTAAMALVVAGNAAATLSYVLHPEYTFVDAARRLTRYIDAHPNGNRILVSISGDQITLATHLPSLCDDFGTNGLVGKLEAYRPGWYAAWNYILPGNLEDLHVHYSLEQVASFRAFDDPNRNVLVLFKLRRLPDGQERDPEGKNLQIAVPGDKIDIPIRDE